MGRYVLRLAVHDYAKSYSNTLILGFKKVANRATTQVMMKTGREDILENYKDSRFG